MQQENQNSDPCLLSTIVSTTVEEKYGEKL
jgi:hypothetical protein